MASTCRRVSRGKSSARARVSRAPPSNASSSPRPYRPQDAPRGPSAALRITAIQARHAAVEQNGGGRVALRAELRAVGVRILGERVALPLAVVGHSSLDTKQTLTLTIRSARDRQ